MADSIYLEKTAVSSVPIWRLNIDQYHEMIRSGILTENDPVELLEGLLVAKMPKNRRHTLSTERTRRAVEAILPQGWHVSSQEPITLTDSEPEPDVMVVRGNLDSYPDRHPGPQEVALVVEVADATLKYDQIDKKRVYARAGIPVYWIENLVDKQIEVYSEPDAADTPDYRQRHVYTLIDTVPLIINGLEIAQLPVKDLLA